jgi:hypothetical protein
MKNESIYLNEISQSLTSFKYFIKNDSIQLTFSQRLLLFFRSDQGRWANRKGFQLFYSLIW